MRNSGVNESHRMRRGRAGRALRQALDGLDHGLAVAGGERGHAARHHAAAQHQLAPGFVARLFLGRFRRVLRHAGLAGLVVFVLLVHSYSFLNPLPPAQADTPRSRAGNRSSA